MSKLFKRIKLGVQVGALETIHQEYQSTHRFKIGPSAVTKVKRREGGRIRRKDQLLDDGLLIYLVIYLEHGLDCSYSNIASSASWNRPTEEKSRNHGLLSLPTC